MKKVHAWFDLLKQDIDSFVGSPTIQADIDDLKAFVVSKMPSVFNEIEIAFANILLKTL